MDIGDVLAAAKVQKLHPLLELDIVPNEDAQRTCIHCTKILDDKDLELIQDITTEETQFLIASDDALKHKVLFVAVFFKQKYDTNPAENDDDDAQGP